MTDSASRSGAGDTAALLVSPQALVAFVVIAGGSWLRAVLVARMSSGLATGETNAAMIALVSLVAGIGLAVLGAGLHFWLSRSLAGPPGSARPPAIGLWLGLALFTIVISFAVSAIAPVIYYGLMGGIATERVLVLLQGFNVAVRAVLFPFSVFMVALAHDGRSDGFGARFGFVLGRGIGYLAAIVAVGFVLVAGQAMLLRGMPPPVVPIVQSLVSGAAQVLFIVIAIGAHRAFRLASDRSSVTFG
jgi:hypothetical protein